MTGEREIKKLREDIKINTIIKFYTLLLLLEGPKHGYEILKRLEEKLDTSVGPSQVYPFLRQLRSAGYISVSAMGQREKKVYSLTKEGEEFVRNLLEKSLELIRASIKALGPERVCPS